MGCKWSGDKGDFHAIHGGVEIDPVEQRLHMKAWKDSGMRQRVMLTGPSGEAHDIMAIQEVFDMFFGLGRAGDNSHNAFGFWQSLAYHIYLMKEGADDKTKVYEMSDKEAPVGRNQPNDELSKSSGQQDSRLARLAELEAEQEKAQQEELMSLDANCWQSMAEQGLFQKAEDLITAAADLEDKMFGRTERYAMLMHSLGALYDFRSNVDVLGQQQSLSLESSKYAHRAVQTLRGVMSGLDDENGAAWLRASDFLAKSLLMRGKSLCNTALDGNCQDLSSEDAFDDAERDVMEAANIRAEMHPSQYAEAKMALGYVFYCRGCRELNKLDGYDDDVARKQSKFVEESLGKALEHYKESLRLYVERVGQEHTDPIRMRCNIALVYNVMSGIPCASRVEYLTEAETQYRQVLRIQEKVFGKRHQRTQRIEVDLNHVVERKTQLMASKPVAPPPGIHKSFGQAALATNAMTEEQIEEAERERKSEADKLMQEFLQARRQERANT